MVSLTVKVWQLTKKIFRKGTEIMSWLIMICIILFVMIITKDHKHFKPVGQKGGCGWFLMKTLICFVPLVEKKKNSDSKLFEFLICSHLNVLRHLQWLCTKIQCQFIWSMVTKKSNIAMQSNDHTSSINTIWYPNYMYWCTGMHA